MLVSLLKQRQFLKNNLITMREIKFRYWSDGIRSKDDSCWDSEKGWWRPYQYEYEGLDEPGMLLKEIQERGIIVEQFTGLKDRNGQDVFEGDMINIGEFKEKKMIVINDIRRIDKILEHTDNYVWVEVIGNIHENKELITTQ